MASLSDRSALSGPPPSALDQRFCRLIDEARGLQTPALGTEPAARRQTVASALERWRYRYLKVFGGHPPAPLARQLEHADVLAHRLRGGEDRAPRAPRRAIESHDPSAEAVARALACLDRGTPLGQIEQRARTATAGQFSVVAADGRTARRVLLYAPLYVSSHCINDCSYCGFRYPQPMPRRHLSTAEAIDQGRLLQRRGFRHLLVVAGEFPSLVSTDYLAAIVASLRAAGATVSLEIAPQSTAAYTQLVAAGAHGLTLYQETYDPALYAQYHRRGTKVSFDWRLEGPERAAEAGIQRLGLGVLLGLAPPESELTALVRHAAYLQRRFPDRVLAFGLPRIHEAPGGFQVPYPIDDQQFIRLYCGLRMAFPAAELVLSTREAPELRNRLAPMCITQLSAGSSTAPGGYHESEAANAHDSAEGQFPVHDQRSVAQVVQWLQAHGIEPVWTTPRDPG